MPITIDLPEELIIEAMRLTQAKSKTAFIITALENLIRKETIQEIKLFKGKVGLNIDLDSLRKRG